MDQKGSLSKLNNDDDIRDETDEIGKGTKSDGIDTVPLLEHYETVPLLEHKETVPLLDHCESVPPLEKSDDIDHFQNACENKVHKNMNSDNVTDVKDAETEEGCCSNLDYDKEEKAVNGAEASNMASDIEDETFEPSHDFIKVIEIPDDRGALVEFRKKSDSDVYANVILEADADEINGQQVEIGDITEIEYHAELLKDYKKTQISQDYDFLVQSLHASSQGDSSMFDSNMMSGSNLMSTSSADALSLLGMKKSIEEEIDTLNYFEFLPAELIVHIFSFLSTFELCKCVAPVCRRWRQLSMDQALWKCINFSSFKQLDSLNLLWVVRRAPLLQKLVIRGRQQITMAEVAIITEFCPGIKDLNLGFCDSLNCDMIQCIVKNCPKLTKINVEGCEKVDSKCIRLLTRCSSLTHINLSHCLLSDSTTKYLCQNMKQIISINLDGISYTTDSVIVAMVNKHVDWLQKLELDGAEISDESLKHLSKCCHLQHLSISFCECLSDQSLIYLKNLKNLKVLRLRKGTDFTVDGLIAFFREANLSQLYSLNLAECSEITDAVVLEIAKSCGKQLTELALSWCWFVTEKGLISIVDHCCNLQVLDVLGVDKITGECLTRVPEEMTHLRFLDLEQCNQIVDSLIYDVVSRKADLQVRNYYGERFVYGDEIVVLPDYFYAPL